MLISPSIGTLSLNNVHHYSLMASSLEWYLVDHTPSLQLEGILVVSVLKISISLFWSRQRMSNTTPPILNKALFREDNSKSKIRRRLP